LEGRRGIVPVGIRVLVELGIGLHLEFGGAEASKRRALNIMMAEMVEPVN
jgi:hypothetical protein